MFLRQNNKRPVESFIVAKAGQVLYNTGGAGDNITNPSTGAIRLADGQIGVFDATGMGSNAINTAITSGNTTQHSPGIFIAQGTADSANPGARKTYPLWSRPFETSGTIFGFRPIIGTKQLYSAPTYSIWNIGQPDGTGVGEIAAYDNTEYQIRAVFRGRRMNEQYHPEGNASSVYSYVTPNYTALGTAEARDHLLQNLAWNINRNSDALNINRTPNRGHDPIIAFLIDSTGSAGVEIGGATPLAAGDVVPVVNTAYGVKSITLSSDQAESIKSAALAQAGGLIANLTWTILAIDLDTAGTTTGGVGDMIMVMGWDSPMVYDDKIPEVKTRLIVGLTSGFDATTSLDEYSSASEGSGTGRHWDILYRRTQGQRKYNLDHTLDPVVEFPSPVDTTANYVSYSIEHYTESQIDTSNVSSSPKKAIVLIPSSETTLISAFDTLMNAWLISANGFGLKSI